MSVAHLEPKPIWTNFAKLNAVPRASKKEERVRQFMIDFGKQLNLIVEEDEVGNILIKKPATIGMEGRKTIILQGHLDMVHQKNSDTNFDFDTQGIDMYVEGDWVKAKGTTLGADNGLGVAAIMAILESSDIVHPNIEALFTIDEETGMTGALGLKGGWLTGEVLLNLDTEDDDEIDIGCAGGIDVTAEGGYIPSQCTLNDGISITVRGLKGGHSGMDIHLGLGNANKLMNRLIYSVLDDVAIGSIEGGSLRNAIPRESHSLLATSSLEKVMAQLEHIKSFIMNEFKSLEPNLQILIEKTTTPATCLPDAQKYLLVKAIYGAINGVYRMSPDIESLVEASNNIARVEIKDGKIRILCLTRSSVESSKMDVAYSLQSVFELAQLEVSCTGSYPGWTPNPNSPVLITLKEQYMKLFNHEPHVVACHAGLECGILGQNYPDMDMISFGPTIKGAHSPDERANIPSSQKFWTFLKEILANI